MFTRNQLRQQFREKRRRLTDAQQRTASQLLASNAKNHKLFEGSTTVAAYLANDGELDPSILIQTLWDNNLTVCLPVLHPFNKKTLLFLKYERNSAMKKNKFGIYEPCLDVTKVVPINCIDIVFTPLVAFDETGNRLGMGGGFYDRSLAIVKKNLAKKPKLIGLAHELQKADKLANERWDIPLDQILTPSQLYSFA